MINREYMKIFYKIRNVTQELKIILKFLLSLCKYKKYLIKRNVLLNIRLIPELFFTNCALHTLKFKRLIYFYFIQVKKGSSVKKE